MLLESQAIKECFKIIKQAEKSLNLSAQHLRTTQRSLGDAVNKLQAQPTPKTKK